MPDEPAARVPLFLAHHALRIEVADTTALAARRRIDNRVDESRLARVHGLVHGAAQFVGRRHMDTHSAEGFYDLVVARVFDEGGRRRVWTTGGIDVGAAIDAVVVEDDDADRQVVPTNRFHLHAREAEGAVALNREHGLSGLHRSPDGKAHADTHDAP